MLDRQDQHPLMKELKERGYSEVDQESQSVPIPIPVSSVLPDLKLELPKSSSKKRKRRKKEEEDPDWQEGDDENVGEELASDDDSIDEDELAASQKKLKPSTLKMKESSSADSQESKTKTEKKTQYGVVHFHLSVMNLIPLLEERSKRVISGQKVIETNQQLYANWISYNQIFEAVKFSHPLYESANSCLKNIEKTYDSVNKSNRQKLLPIANSFLEKAKNQLNDILAKLNKPWSSSDSLPKIEAMPEEITAVKKRKKYIQLTRSKPSKPLQTFSLFKPVSISMPQSQAFSHDLGVSSSHSHSQSCSHSHSHVDTPAQTIPVAAPSLPAFAVATDISSAYYSHFLIFQEYINAVEQQKIAAHQFQASTDAVIRASEKMRKMTDQFMVAMGSGTTGLFGGQAQPDSQSLPMQPESGTSLGR